MSYEYSTYNVITGKRKHNWKLYHVVGEIIKKIFVPQKKKVMEL